MDKQPPKVVVGWFSLDDALKLNNILPVTQKTITKITQSILL